MRNCLILFLLATTAQGPLYAQEAPALSEWRTADTAQAPPQDDGPAAASDPASGEPEEDYGEEEEGEEIVVTGQRLRGAVIGDIEPEVSLDRRDIRAYGAGSLAELLDALAPQTRSGRGRGGERPVLLVNGRRISGFSEIRGIPPEAIERVDILPEEVALKYGYRADQRVVNFVLRRRFRAITAEAEGGLATGGGRDSQEAEINILRLNRNGRWSVEFDYERDSALFESERNIIADDPPGTPDTRAYRSLLPLAEEASVNATLNRTIFGNVSATLNGEFQSNSTTSFLGLADIGGDRPLVRDTNVMTYHLGLALNGDLASWRWSATGNYDRSESDSLTDTDSSGDRAQSWSQTAEAELVANGSLFDLPAGAVSATIRAGGETRGLRSAARRAEIFQQRSLSRDQANMQANLDLPIAKRRNGVLAAIGDLSANLNLEVEELSDFGTLRTLGGGFNWSPFKPLDIILSVTDEEGAPSMQQLGDPTVLTPNVRVFDFIRGQTVDIDRIDGGNPALRADNRRVFKAGLTLKPFDETDLSITANYTNSRIRNPIASFPTATPEIEAAFPDRFARDASGGLVSIDSRPVNFQRSARRELRWGLNFSQPIGPERRAGGQSGRGGWRGRSQPADGASTTATSDNPSSLPSDAREAQRGAGGGGRGRGGFGRGGRGQGGRLQFSLYHNIRLVDRILIREGVPELDLLGGSAVGSRGGQPRHEIEAQAGIYKNGFGARLTGNWQSGTKVNGGIGGAPGAEDLFFSDIATLNVRLFADLGQQRSLIRAHRWLRGARVSLSVTNLFDTRIDVQDRNGLTPIGYQPDLLDPLGRSVRLSIRKLFF
ncbi:TonB-dependent receptor [Sphingosinicella rhizophila]|uniref:TonB-dependent receptor plug domain-containing protein n=1 Tax=Sphingosinicella rhizophila TaxID=3050082 RepID=A0ABU3Q4L8_9SPHN|nr:TonB-dependent receptor plug domain-containing protein [Sphingosinicella sp. GR2756]MDT9598009.1 TonB-dependent receptor plug domain-containing protein [Sphingosinicella sp. GR2756]